MGQLDESNPGHNGPTCVACGFEHEQGRMGVDSDSMLDAVECCPRCGFQYDATSSDPQSFDELRDDSIHYEVPDEELGRRLPALELISDDEIRAETARLSANAPPYFWVVAASTYRYHHPFCRGDRGLWAHTLMVSSAYERLVDSYVKQDRIDEDEADLGRAACILHDQRKRGGPLYPQDKSTQNHDLQMARVIREESALDDRVAHAVESHMGPWYDGPMPSTELDQLVHSADMMASTENATLAVPGPVPGELQALGVEQGSF